MRPLTFSRTDARSGCCQSRLWLHRARSHQRCSVSCGRRVRAPPRRTTQCVKGTVDLTWKTEVLSHHALVHRKHEKLDDKHAGGAAGSWDITALTQSTKLDTTFWIVNGTREFALCATSKAEMQSWISAIRHNIELRVSYHSKAKLSLSELSVSLAKINPWAGDATAQNRLRECVRFVEERCEKGNGNGNGSEEIETVLKAWRVKAWGQSAVGQKLSIFKERTVVLTTLAFYR